MKVVSWKPYILDIYYLKYVYSVPNLNGHRLYQVPLIFVKILSFLTTL